MSPEDDHEWWFPVLSGNPSRMIRFSATITTLYGAVIQRISRTTSQESPITWMLLWSVPKESAPPTPFCSSRVRSTNIQRKRVRGARQPLSQTNGFFCFSPCRKWCAQLRHRHKDGEDEDVVAPACLHLRFPLARALLLLPRKQLHQVQPADGRGGSGQLPEGRQKLLHEVPQLWWVQRTWSDFVPLLDTIYHSFSLSPLCWL